MANFTAHMSEITITDVFIKDEDGDVLINLGRQGAGPSTDGGKLTIGTIELVESIGAVSVNGTIVIHAGRGQFEALQLLGNESIQFVFETPSQGDGETETLTSPDFSIVDFDDSSDFTELSKEPEGGKPRSITLTFTSKQEKEVFDSENPFPFGFLGKVAVTPTTLPGQELLDEEGEEGEDREEDDPETPADPCPAPGGIINEISNSFFQGENFEIEATDNTIFLSPHRFSFPSRQITKNMNLLQLINYCTRNAWKAGSSSPQSNRGWANYAFWQDLFGWHFKSIHKMVQDGQANSIQEFSLTGNIQDQKRILKLDPMSDFSESKAWSTGMMYSYHTRIEPNYSDLYSRFMNDDNKYTENSYEFNYATDYSPMIEPGKFLPPTYRGNLLADWIVGKANESLIIKDSLFGWYDNRQHNNKTDIHRIIGRGRDKNAPGPLGATGENAVLSMDPISLKEFCDYNYYQDNLWQEMFDCVRVGSPENLNEDFCNLYKLTRIKANTFNAKKQYNAASSYKEKWNVYRYSVCCEVPESEQRTSTFAIIKGHHKLAGASNIFEYDWAEVCIIPKAAIEFVVGHENENGISDWFKPLVGSDAPLNAVSLEDKTNLGLCKIYPYTNNICDESDIELGKLSGIVRFESIAQTENEEDAGLTFAGVTGSISWDYVKNLFDGATYAEGLTLTFHNSQYSPFLVVEKPKGGSGIDTDNRAYNLNEIMNRPILEEANYPVKEGPQGVAGPGARDTIFWQETPADTGDHGFNPFESAVDGEQPDKTQYMVGPGVNASESFLGVDYPAAYDTMPIGSYKKVSDVGSLVCNAVPLGYVVKLEFASFDEIHRLGIESKSTGSPYGSPNGIYYFSVANAHDGMCEGTCVI